MENPVKQRIKNVLAYYGVSQNKFANGDIALQKRLSTQLNGNTALTFQTIYSIIEKFPEVSTDWLLTGDGEMLRGKHKEYTYEVEEVFSSKVAESKGEEDIPLYDVSAAANLLSIFDPSAKQNIIDHIRVPNVPKCDGAVYVRGDSMSPLLRSGDIVAFKFIRDIQNIIWGEMYLVDMVVEDDDYLVVKYVQKSDKGEDWVKLVSHNSFYDPKHIHKSSIRSIALVKFSIRMNTIN